MTTERVRSAQQRLDIVRRRRGQRVTYDARSAKKPGFLRTMCVIGHETS